MKKILTILIIQVSFFSFIRVVKASTIWNINTTDCSGLGGEDQTGYTANACDNTVYTTATVYGWDSNGHPAIHVKAETTDVINISVQTAIFEPDNNYIVVAWSNTYIDWSGFIGGAWFGCNGVWGCPTISHVPPDNQNGFSGTTTFSGSTDYYVATIAHCGSVSSGCSANIKVNCSTCTIDGVPTPKPTPTETPSPTPSTTPSPTPTPTNIPVTKVFFAPGLGASWNLNDFINCKSNSNSNSWSLAPYAKTVYSDVLSALESAGWNVKPFYYDWRKNVWNNAEILKSFITQNTSQDEKVDFVGHSMGGLLGRSYFESNQGGQLAKFLTVGTPHQGSAFAYAPWSGGDIWRNNLIETIAINLYLKHCGGTFSNNRQTIQSQFPSIQNLLPTVPYLRDVKTKTLKQIASMDARNNFILNDFTTEFWGVKVGAISGKGQKTLKEINTITPLKTDTKMGNWLDGFPISKEYSNEGDGTVLASSSQIPGAINTTIQQTHSGLVGTTDGINQILTFLGSPGIDDPPYEEPTSALI